MSSPIDFLNSSMDINLDMRKCIFFCVLIFLPAGGCNLGAKKALTDAQLERIALAYKIELEEASGGLVIMVGGEPVTSKEIIEQPVQFAVKYVSPLEFYKPIAQDSTLEQFKQKVRSQLSEIVLSRISSILLYQYAKRQAGKNIDDALEKAAENELRKFVLNYGGDQVKADDALKERGMDRKKFKEDQKKSILVQWYVTSKLPANRPITYSELVERYNELKDKYFSIPSVIQFRLIDIKPDELEITDPNDNRLELAKKKAYEILARIESGEDFGGLAKQFSHGHMSQFDGLWKPLQPTSLIAPYDVLAVEAEKIEQGQIAGPIEAPGHVFIMKLEEKQLGGYEPFEKVQDQVEQSILYERRNDVVMKINEKLVQQAELGDTDKFVDFCLERIYELSRQ